MTENTKSKYIKQSHAEVEEQKIKKALREGVARQNPVAAPPSQTLTYVLAKRRFFHHATVESASAERYFLQAALGQRVRVMKIWNTGRDQIQDDMSLLRGMLSETESWDPAQEALDRVLKGAGY